MKQIQLIKNLAGTRVKVPRLSYASAWFEFAVTCLFFYANSKVKTIDNY